MTFGQIGFQCPVDGPMTVGLDCIEDMVIHQRGHADITLRCPRCGTVVRLTTPVPIIPRPIVEAISKDFGIPLEDGKLVFSALINSFGSNAREIEFSFEADGDFFDDFGGEAQILEERKLSEGDEQQLGFFASELGKLDSVDAFLSRVDEDASDAGEFIR